jgi:hypothetical protein
MLGFVADDADEGARYVVRLAAKLSTTSDDVPVIVRELGREGAIVEGDKLPRAGKDVFLSRSGQTLFAEVVSRTDGRCLLAFEEALDEGDMLLWMHAPNEEAQPILQQRLRRPGSRGERASMEEWKLLRSLGFLSDKGALEH